MAESPINPTSPRELRPNARVFKSGFTGVYMRSNSGQNLVGNAKRCHFSAIALRLRTSPSKERDLIFRCIVSLAASTSLILNGRKVTYVSASLPTQRRQTQVARTDRRNYAREMLSGEACHASQVLYSTCIERLAHVRRSRVDRIQVERFERDEAMLGGVGRPKSTDPSRQRRRTAVKEQN